MPTLDSIHVQTEPPDILIIYWGTNQLVQGLPWLSEPLVDWARGMLSGPPWLTTVPKYASASTSLIGILTPLISPRQSKPCSFLSG